MRLKTKRLGLVPLLSCQLRLWAEDIPSLEVEIGYGLEKDFEHNGYMTEAGDYEHIVG